MYITFDVFLNENTVFVDKGVFNMIVCFYNVDFCLPAGIVIA